MAAMTTKAAFAVPVSASGIAPLITRSSWALLISRSSFTLSAKFPLTLATSAWIPSRTVSTGF